MYDQVEKAYGSRRILRTDTPVGAAFGEVIVCFNYKNSITIKSFKFSIT